MEDRAFSTFGEMLRTLRRRQRFTQQRLAERLGVHRSTIGTWERGDFLPESKGIVLELARSLRLDDQETRQLLEASLTALAPYWSVPYLRNPFFTGREEILSELHTRLSPDQAIALTQSHAMYGLGGIGKTQIAIEYAYQHALEYSAVFWIGAETVESLSTSFLHLAELLQLPERREADQQRIVAAVQRWLSTHSGWLLIWDNLEDLELLQRFLPPTRQGAILITTRCQSLGTQAQGLELPMMQPEEGSLLLLRRAKVLRPEATSEHLHQLATTKPEEYAAARGLVGAMEGLPLALDQAGAYLEETGCGLPAYWQRYQQQRALLLDRRGTQAGEHPQSVTATFLLAIERIEQDHPEAVDLLRMCAFLHAEDIPEELLRASASHLGPRLASVVADPCQLDLTLAVLRTFSLLQRQTETQTLSLHRLLQAVVRDHLETRLARLWAERAVRAVNEAFSEPGFATWVQCERLVVHAQACRFLIEHMRISIPEAILLLRKTGNYLERRGRAAEATPLVERALALQEQQAEPDQLEVAATLSLLGLLYWDLHQHELAERMLHRALLIREQVLGLEHPHTAECHNNLGLLYWNQGKYEQAESAWLRALRVCEQQPGQEYVHTIESLINVGFAYLRREAYGQAEPLLQRALVICEHHLDPDHPLTSTALSHLGTLYQEQRKYKQAESLLQRVLAIQEQQKGAEYPAILRRLGKLYQEQGKHEQAKSLLQQALAIQELRLGLDDPVTAVYLAALGELDQKQGKYEQAEQWYQRALGVWEEAWGPEHPRVASTLSTLASLSTEQGKYEQAEVMYQRALTIQEHHLQPDHPETTKTRAGLANLSQKRKNFELAEVLPPHAHVACEQSLGQTSPETLPVGNDRDVLEQRRRAAMAPIDERREAKQVHLGSVHQSRSFSGRPSPEESSTAIDQECDSLSAFLSACCELRSRAWSRASDLWHAYERWAAAQQERFPLSRRAFSAQLKAHGCRADRTNTARIWRGIALTNPNRDEK